METTAINQKWFAAAQKGDIATVRALIVSGIDIDQRDDQERTAFHIASSHADTDMMTTILAARKMNFLRGLGIDPFAPAAASSASASETQPLRAVRRSV